jgi:hypothetical protein
MPSPTVMPAKAGIHSLLTLDPSLTAPPSCQRRLVSTVNQRWIPASAGMTNSERSLNSNIQSLSYQSSSYPVMPAPPSCQRRLASTVHQRWIPASQSHRHASEGWHPQSTNAGSQPHSPAIMPAKAGIHTPATLDPSLTAPPSCQRRLASIVQQRWIPASQPHRHASEGWHPQSINAGSQPHSPTVMPAKAGIHSPSTLDPSLTAPPSCQRRLVSTVY